MRNTMRGPSVAGHWCSLTLAPRSVLGQVVTAAAVLLRSGERRNTKAVQGGGKQSK